MAQQRKQHAAARGDRRRRSEAAEHLGRWRGVATGRQRWAPRASPCPRFARRKKRGGAKVWLARDS